MEPKTVGESQVAPSTPLGGHVTFSHCADVVDQVPSDWQLVFEKNSGNENKKIDKKRFERRERRKEMNEGRKFMMEGREEERKEARKEERKQARKEMNEGD